MAPHPKFKAVLFDLGGVVVGSPIGGIYVCFLTQWRLRAAIGESNAGSRLGSPCLAPFNCTKTTELREESWPSERYQLLHVSFLTKLTCRWQHRLIQLLRHTASPRAKTVPSKNSNAASSKSVPSFTSSLKKTSRIRRMWSSSRSS